jgi:hypothetical protein
MTASLKFGFVFVISALLATAAGSEAFAGERIGVAATVRNRVSGKIQAQPVPINSGESVYDREYVKTEADSSAKIVLKDDANINVGPNSAVTLDGFVFSGEQDYKKAGVNFAKGAFRFTSGGSNRDAYQVKTPTATIGVRG